MNTHKGFNSLPLKSLCSLGCLQLFLLLQLSTPTLSQEGTSLTAVSPEEGLFRHFPTANIESRDEHSRVSDLAASLFELGDVIGAIQLQEDVVQYRQETIGEDNYETVTAKSELAKMYLAKGDLVTAQSYLLEVVQSLEWIPEATRQDVLNSRANLATIYYHRGDLENARTYQEEIWVELERLLGPAHPDNLTAMGNLAATLFAKGALYKAQDLQEQVLQRIEKAPGDYSEFQIRANASLAAIEHTLSFIKNPFFEKSPSEPPPPDPRWARNFQEELVEDLQRSLGIRHPETGLAMHNLATMLFSDGQLREAESIFHQLVESERGPTQEIPPLSTERRATQYFFLGAIRRQLGQPDAAVTAYQQGLDVLEAQARRVDVSELGQNAFRDTYKNQYHELMTLWLELGQPGRAFQILERYRNQGLQALFRWEPFDFRDELPQWKEKELKTRALEYNQLTQQLDHLRPDPPLEEQRRRLRFERERLRSAVAKPHQTEGDRFKPFDIELFQKSIDPGTLFLAFSIGETTSFVFTLTNQNIEVHRLDVRAIELWSQIRNLRTLDLNPDKPRPNSRNPLSSWLYGKLFSPVDNHLQDAQRIVVLPDGPLNYLHLAALTRTSRDRRRGWQFLVEWKPVHVVQSATVYAELKARRSRLRLLGDPSRRQWVGVGNPQVALGGLNPLPYSAREIQRIAQLFPKGTVQTFLQAEANEGRVRGVLGLASIVHFATHGLIDPTYPMDSFLALSLLEDQDDAQHNGLLQAWEIAHDFRLEADLVVLSACETALGPSHGGSGLISLSRAFQIAGARSVLASLWAVNDLSTSELMIRFYKHLRNGETKDRALQLAQQEFIAGPIEVTLDDGTVVTKDFSAPYHWAAFQLIGDWR